jgi:hypothetical protein
MIRFMQLRLPGVRAVFANGTWYERIYLWFRGYRRHETLIGPVMTKFWRNDT